MELNKIGNIFQKFKHTYQVNSVEKSNSVTNAEESKKGLKEPRLKSRHLVIVLLFMGEFVFCYQRTAMGVSLVAMVNQSSLPQLDKTITANSCLVDNTEIKNSSTGKVMHIDGEFSWSPKIQGYVLMISFLCNTIFFPVLSKLGEIYGGKRVFFWNLFLTAVFNFISPFAARWSVYALILTQGLIGVAQAGYWPGVAILIANWFPKQERSFAFSCMGGGAGIGCFLGGALTGLLCDSVSLGGWPSAFFMAGAISFTLSMMVLFLMYDNPSVHPRISQAEREYIFNNQETILTEKRPKTPWKELLTSVPVYALAYAYFGQVWAISYFSSMNPTYLRTILHYSTEKSGLMSSMSFITSSIVSISCCFFTKFLTDKNYATVNTTSKCWNSFCCLGFSLCILGIYFAECSTYEIIVISVLVSVFYGSSCMGCWIVCTDMSPTFAASINSIAFTVGSCGYMILPITVGYLTDGEQTMEQWHKIFIISIAILFSSGLVFAIFGSAKIQPWNDVRKSISGEVKEKKNQRPECDT